MKRVFTARRLAAAARLARRRGAGRGCRRAALALLAAALLAACAAEPAWQSQVIEGTMPPLAYTLTSETGETVDERALAGTVRLLFFGYTQCPDVCPMTLSKLKGALERLPPALAERVRVMFVSVDPGRDDPAQLREYTNAFGGNFVGLTGTEAQLDALTGRYHTIYELGVPNDAGDYPVAHGSVVYVFDARGEARLLIRNSDTVAAVASDLGRLARQAAG